MIEMELGVSHDKKKILLNFMLKFLLKEVSSFYYMSTKDFIKIWISWFKKRSYACDGLNPKLVVINKLIKLI